MKPETVDVRERLGTLNFNTDHEDHAHISVNPEICDQCPHFRTVAACPAGCFKFIDGKMVYRYEDCIECGTCYLQCDQGSVSWSHPRGNFGVEFKLG